MISTERSEATGLFSATTCTAPVTTTAAKACTGYVRRNTTGTTMPAMNGILTRPSTPNSGMPEPMAISSSASVPSTSRG